MKKSQEENKFGPHVVEPTKEEIEKAIEKFKNKYDVVIPRADAAKYAKLTSELGYWLTVEKACESKECITEEMAEEVQAMVKKNRGKDISLEQAYLEAKKSLLLTIPYEKERIAGEIRAIIAKYK